MQHRRRKDGYSLVELLVVMGIMAVLITMVMPVLSGIRGKAHRMQCQSNLRQLDMAFRIYVDEHDGVYPYDLKPRAPALTGTIPAADGTNKWDASPVVAELQPYIDSPKVGFCPDYPKSLPDSGPLTNYEFNGLIALNDSPQAPHAGPVTDADIVNPGHVFVFGDYFTGSGSHAGYRNFAMADGSVKAFPANQWGTAPCHAEWWY